MNPEDPVKLEAPADVPVEVVEDDTVPVGFVRFRGRLITKAQAQHEVEKLRRRQARAMREAEWGVAIGDLFVEHNSPGGGRAKQVEIKRRARNRKRNKRRR